MQKFETLTKLKIFNNHLFIFTSTSTYLRFSIALPSSFSHLPIRIAPSFIHLFSICPCGSHRLLFVLCSFFVRSLFVLCSFFVRSLFVLCSFFVRSLFVLCSFFVRLLFICPCGSHRLLFICPSCYDCLCGSHYLPVVLRPRIVLPFTFYLLPI